jgi:hypothetical protein
MLVKSWRFITLILSALVMGMAFCHALELPAKMQYSAAQYITTQNSLYVALGPPNIGAAIEVAAPLMTIALAILVHKRRPALQLTLVAIAANTKRWELWPDGTLAWIVLKKSCNQRQFSIQITAIEATE